MLKRFRPDPDEQVALIPPGRQPPTAVGVATPPPPDPPGAPIGDRASLVARIAQAQLGCVLSAGGLIAGAFLPLGPLIGAGLVFVGSTTVCRAVTGVGLLAWLGKQRRLRRAAAAARRSTRAA